MTYAQRLALLRLAVCASMGVVGVVTHTATPPSSIQFVFTSDAHYGLTRATFRGRTHVAAQVVNRALVARINELPAMSFPADGGVRAGKRIDAVDFIVEGGDVANREESGGKEPIQAASVSWQQFLADYGGLTVRTGDDKSAPLFVVPGNHDASNAIGFYEPMTPPSDAAPLVDLFNRMLHPAVPLTRERFDYDRDRVRYAMDLSGIHFVFLHIWPDSEGRAWLERDLARIGTGTPVVIFVHDQPEAQAKHFINPNGGHTVNATDKFENLLSDVLADGTTVDAPTTIEQRGFEEFLVKHPNVTAYFHGNSNWNEFYDWQGPGHAARLNVFRVDSPMKGKFSTDDERRLSFHVAAIDVVTARLTVREYLWNASRPWGANRSVDLRPRSDSEQQRAAR